MRFAGARLLPIRVDGEGLVVEDLERHLKTKKVRMIYLTPLHHYPTTVTLSLRGDCGFMKFATDRNFRS